MTISAENIQNSRRAFEAGMRAITSAAHAMAEAEAPNGQAAFQMHALAARQSFLEAVAFLDGRHRTVTLPMLPTKLEAR